MTHALPQATPGTPRAGETPDGAARPTRSSTPWALVALLCATATAGYICRVNVSTAGPFLMQEFGLTQVEIGRVFSAFLLGYTVSMVPGGALGDRWGARRLLTAATWSWVALTLMQAAVGWGPFAPWAFLALPAFMVLRLVLGIAAAPTYPAAAAGVAAWVPSAAHGRATGTVLASIGLGSAISAPLVSVVALEWLARGARRLGCAGFRGGTRMAPGARAGPAARDGARRIPCRIPRAATRTPGRMASRVP